MNLADRRRPPSAPVNGQAAGRIAAGAPAAPRRSTFDALRIPGFPLLWASSWLWQLSRWGISFLGAYLAKELSGSPRLIQLTGVAMWAPLLLGGMVGGVISERFDRRRTVITQFAVVIPLAVLLGVLRLAGWLELWMLYPFLLVVGVGWVIDMTSRRAMIYDLVGPDRIDNAMALESVSLSGGLAVGALVGGSVIEALGVGVAFLVIAAILAVALAVVVRLPRIPHSHRPTAAQQKGAVREGFGLLKTNKGLVSILGVTVFVNFFYFTYTPLVQVIGKGLEVGAFYTGLLASMTGFGMMVGSTLMARYQPRRRGLLYVAGTLGAAALLPVFAQAQWYALALPALFLSSLSNGLFGATQGVLVMTSVSSELRGRALGLLSMAIGALPVGMIVLGEVAEVIGAPAAITISSLTGAVLTLVWLARRPEVLKMTT
ncbi:MAG: MFS transporter [Acidimicrobiales bacterium]